MRIIAGKWRGRPLIAPAGDATRPTADRTREALFSMLTSRLGSFEGLRVADPTAPVTIVASPRLARLYRTVLDLAGRPAAGVVDGGEASARGLWRIWEART